MKPFRLRDVGWFMTGARKKGVRKYFSILEKERNDYYVKNNISFFSLKESCRVMEASYETH